ncbi:hypothetical protein [Longimicrobium sp.]|uniref:hypothetical protein n=1 Tax=Longimicrobium sp. TaxID=2029185 RepID=UPI002D7E4A9A|nr:hypothetical protein [Longimicrobium sp.]
MRALRVWLVLVVAMVANGALRAMVEPRIGAAAAQVVSVAMGIGLILLITRPFIAAAQSLSTVQRTEVAGAWVALTVLFEFGFGHYAMGASWTELFANYDLLQGRLWPLILVALAVSPFLWRPRRPLHFAPHSA